MITVAAIALAILAGLFGFCALGAAMTFGKTNREYDGNGAFVCMVVALICAFISGALR